MFPGAKPSEASGHYWLVVLNIKAQRFEIYDSLATKKREALMMEDTHYLIVGIKTMWLRLFTSSKVQIANWPIELIDSPRQDNRQASKSLHCSFLFLSLVSAEIFDSLTNCSFKKNEAQV